MGKLAVIVANGYEAQLCDQLDARQAVFGRSPEQSEWGQVLFCVLRPTTFLDT